VGEQKFDRLAKLEWHHLRAQMRGNAVPSALWLGGSNQTGVLQWDNGPDGTLIVPLTANSATQAGVFGVRTIGNYFRYYQGTPDYVGAALTKGSVGPVNVDGVSISQSLFSLWYYSKFIYL